MKKFLALLAIITFAAAGALAGGITVDGTAERMVEPNLAQIELGVETQGDTAQNATSKNAELMNQVQESLRKANIAKEDLKTSSFSLSPQYHYPKGEPAVLTGYLASNLLRITLRSEDLKRIGEIIDLATEAGANRVRNVVFSVENSEELELELLAEAVKNAQRKAQTMAQAANVKLGKLLDLSNASASILPVRMAFQEDTFALKQASTPIQPGEIKISARVNLRYDIGN